MIDNPPLATPASFARLRSDLAAHVSERDQLYADLAAAAQRSRRLWLPSAVVARLVDDVLVLREEHARCDDHTAFEWESMANDLRCARDAQYAAEAALRLESAKHDRLVARVGDLETQLRVWMPREVMT